MPAVLTIRMKDGSTDKLSRGEAIHVVIERVIATGDDWNKCREVWKNSPEMIEVIDWLEENTDAHEHYERE